MIQNRGNISLIIYIFHRTAILVIQCVTTLLGSWYTFVASRDTALLIWLVKYSFSMTTLVYQTKGARIIAVTEEDRPQI